jgi:hypothetical protein
MATTKPQTTATIVQPGSFEAHEHWYPKALNATIHPMISFFLNLSQDRIVKRYCHMHPTVSAEDLKEVLNYKSKHFLWSGADLLNVTSAGGKRQMVVIENNSCPSGQKSMPLLNDNQEQGSYRLLIERTFKPFLKNLRKSVKGGLAVIYDKNPMETSGYAEVIADVMNEPVYYVPFYIDDEDPAVKYVDGIMHVRNEEGEFVPIRAAFRYLTQKPWNRLPLHSKTRILNPIIACLAGGRNKMVAAKAYDFYNTDLQAKHLKINTPETIWDVSKNEVPLWVKKMGGHAVVKIPYSNAGQGVFTIVNQQELDNFMALDFDYDLFIVQSLIGGIRPLCTYARRSAKPLTDRIKEGAGSWEMLGTNLSYKKPDGSWGSDTNRLILMDRRDFNKLGIGLDDLIEAFIQTVLSTVAIDKMAQTLVNKQGKFRMRLFKSLNDDAGLIEEIKLD